MPFMVWNDKLSVGVAVLDQDHRHLIELVNQLYDGIQEGQRTEVLAEVLRELSDYTRYHFAREERFFDKTSYPGAERHRRAHNRTLEWVMERRAEFRRGGAAAPSLEVMNYLKDWIFDHILKSDQDYGPHLNGMGIY